VARKIFGREIGGDEGAAFNLRPSVHWAGEPRPGGSIFDFEESQGAGSGLAFEPDRGSTQFVPVSALEKCDEQSGRGGCIARY